MKIDFGETRLEKIDRLSKPHKWFAWYPVEISAHDYRWLEYVERTGCLFFRSVEFGIGWYWKYKAIPKTVGDVLKGTRMTKEEIFLLAEKADLYLASDDSIIKFAKLIAEKEREDCAKLCEEYFERVMASRIRARGQE